jgi:iron complex transport system ATP-binding protein
MFFISGGRVFAEGRPDDIMTEENLGEVFGISARIVEDSSSGRPYCIPDGRKDFFEGNL